MSTEQHDAYGEKLSRISRHQSDAVTARTTVFETLALVGVSPEEADELVAQLEAGAVAGAHTWISESSPRPVQGRISRTAGSRACERSRVICCASPTPPPPSAGEPSPTPNCSPTYGSRAPHTSERSAGAGRGAR
ncbi:hypothetical protein [Streptomyces asiaticus]|uniref:hypothetical protein n=1 Tax=Streptomyces asiaticus TaxID=114695 RepID=UPI003F67BEB3